MTPQVFGEKKIKYGHSGKKQKSYIYYFMYLCDREEAVAEWLGGPCYRGVCMVGREFKSSFEQVAWFFFFFEYALIHYHAS